MEYKQAAMPFLLMLSLQVLFLKVKLRFELKFSSLLIYMDPMGKTNFMGPDKGTTNSGWL